MSEPSKFTDTQYAIIDEISTFVYKSTGNLSFCWLLNSWGNTLPDDVMLARLKEINGIADDNAVVHPEQQSKPTDILRPNEEYQDFMRDFFKTENRE